MSESDLLLPEEVRANILRELDPLPPKRLPLAEAGGLVLAESVVAPFDLPRFANAAMDGFAVRSEDLAEAAAGRPCRLEVTGRALAGRPATVRLVRGTAVIIATGALLPDGADAVVPVEEVAREDRDGIRFVQVSGPVPAGQHVRSVGEDVRAGTTLVEAGTELGAGQLAAAAAVGLAEASVRPPPRVAVVPTGDEVRPPGEELRAGQVFDAVSAPLAWLLREAGARPVLRPVAPDEPARLAEDVRAAAGEADAIVTIGGVSMGERDLVRRLGGSVRGVRVALRPAKPFAFGRAFGVPLFGLPGNPAAALAAFEELVRPVLLAMLGRAPVARASVWATLTEALDQQPGRLHLLRAEVWRQRGQLLVRPAGEQGAGMVHSLARASGWAILPAEATHLPAGTEIEVRLLVEVP